MKFDKGLFLDSSNTNQPQGTWKHMLNGTFDKDLGVVTDEEGFRQFGKNLPSTSCIGVLPIDSDIITFFAGVSSDHEIGIINENGQYNRIILCDVFNFSSKYPIKAKVIKNYKGERIIVFIDDNNSPKVVNIDDIPYTLNVNREYSGTDVNKFELFPNYTEAKITSCSIGKGGKLLTGTYYIITQYENTSSNIKTAWSKQSCPFHISADSSKMKRGSESNIDSNKHIDFTISNIDTTFDKINVGIVYEIEGVTYARNYGTKVITSSSIANYTISSNEGTDLTLEETLINSTNYVRVGDIEITDNELLGANVVEEEEINFQKYANLIEINYVATYETIEVVNTSMNESQIIGVDKGFRSGEVYAFYCSLLLKKGGESRLFHITGRPPVAGETSTSTYTASEGLTSGTKVFQVENTADAGGALTNMGYWENSNEVYPSIDDFDSSDITNPSTASAGIDLQGEQVRHHRFPNQRSLASGGSSDFGINEFCKLGIVASNIIIPSNLVDKIEGVKIYYAKRDIENMTCLGQSLFQFAHENTLSNENVDMSYIGNYRSEGVTFPQFNPIQEKIRFYDFSLLKLQPLIKPDYITNQIELERTGIHNANNGEYGENTTIHADYHIANLNLTHTSGVLSGSAVPNASYIRRVDDSLYVPSNVKIPKSNNTQSDEHLLIELNTTTDLSIWANSTSTTNYASDTDPTPDTFNEQVYLTDLNKILLNAYLGFDSDKDVVCTQNNANGQYLTVSSAGTKSTGTLYNGDTFLDFDSIRKYSPIVPVVFDPDNPDDSLLKGNFAHKYFIHESIVNTRFRYSDGTVENEYFPNLPVSGFGGAYSTFRYSIIDTHELFYSTDFNQLNDNDSVIIYDPSSEVVNRHPFRIIRSNTINRDGKLDISFPPLNYYEISKKREEISGINYYNDKLTIRCRNGAYITRPKQKIITDAGDATIGTNDIFDIEPKELLTTDNGFIKSKSKFDTVLIEHGLVLLDAVEGKMFLLTDQVLELSSRELGLQNYLNNIFYNDVDLDLEIDFNSGSIITTYDASNRIKVKLNVSYDISILDFKKGDYLWLVTEQSFCKILKIYGETDYSTSVDYVTLETDYVDASPVNQNIKYYRKHSSVYYDSGTVFGWNKKENTLYTTIKRKNTLPLIYSTRYVGHYYNISSFTDDLQIGDVVKFEGDYKVWDGAALGTALTLEDIDITLSYNFDVKRWISFHSYIPTTYAYINDKLLSIYDGELYKHNQLNRKGQYYSGTRENFEISVIFNNGNALNKKYFGLEWVANFMDSSLLLQEDATFETIQCTNEYEDLTEITLVPFTDLSSIGNARNIKGTWNYNALKNSSNKLMTDKYLLVKFTDSQSFSLYLYSISAHFRLLDKLENGN